MSEHSKQSSGVQTWIERTRGINDDKIIRFSKGEDER
jgi:hypothetical protein